MQVLASSLLPAISVVATPVASHAGVGVYIGVAPPAPRVEVVPVARVGYTWAPGYWRWNGYRHMWVSTYWLRARLGWHWVGPHWSAYGARWHYVGGYWAR